jgi:aromatic ring-opening dioxygenase catalytic subunit (LigB family)
MTSQFAPASEPTPSRFGYNCDLAFMEGDWKWERRSVELGALASAAHPTCDHFLPLLYVLGAQGEGESVSAFNQSFQEPSVSMKSFVLA